MLLVPVDVAPWLWGWPDRFLARMAAAGMEVFVAGPWEGARYTRGIDDEAAFRRLPSGYAGGVWTIASTASRHWRADWYQTLRV